MRPKALLFDVFGTLVDWRTSVANQAAAMHGETPESGGSWTDFADAWRARYQPAMEEVREGRRSFVVLDVLHRENLDRILPDFGLADISDDLRDEMTLFWHKLDPWPDSPGGMKRLRTRYDVAAHSNGNIALMSELSRHANLPFTNILGAEATGYYKPRPESYLGAARRLSLAPEQCMMVAAHNADLFAARELGFQTAFFARPMEYGPDQAGDLEADQQWDYIVGDLEELAGKLNC